MAFELKKQKEDPRQPIWLTNIGILYTNYKHTVTSDMFILPITSYIQSKTWVHLNLKP